MCHNNLPPGDTQSRCHCDQGEPHTLKGYPTPDIFSDASQLKANGLHYGVIAAHVRMGNTGVKDMTVVL